MDFQEILEDFSGGLGSGLYMKLSGRKKFKISHVWKSYEFGTMYL